MRISYFVLLLACFTFDLHAQEVTAPLPSMDNASADRPFLEQAKDIVKASDRQERLLCIVNPTQQNNVESYWSLVLIKWLVNTGQYSTLYFDMNAFVAMICDRYVVGDNHTTAHDVEKYLGVYCNQYNIETSTMMLLLSEIRDYNCRSEQKVRIYGLDYDYGILPSYDGEYHLVDSLMRCAIGQTSYKPTHDYLLKNEQKERGVIGESYDVYKRFFDIDRARANLVTSRESRMFDELVYWQNRRGKESKSILYMSIWSLRDTPGVSNIRNKMKQQFRSDDYRIVNLVDDMLKEAGE
ncbi:MAG: hypothetical protein MJY95_01360 [Bacteroidaceae bacterium]|nr:hypothetical protein [Bacteroidaceae bacterium]